MLTIQLGVTRVTNISVQLTYQLGLTEVDNIVPPTPPASGNYVAEDGISNYVTEDGLGFYVTET